MAGLKLNLMDWPKLGKRPSLVACCNEGCFFCTHCQKVVGVGVDGGTVCLHCRTSNVVWLPGMTLLNENHARPGTVGAH